MILCQWKILRIIIHINKGLAVAMHSSKKGWWPHYLFISITTICAFIVEHTHSCCTPFYAPIPAGPHSTHPFLLDLILHTHSCWTSFYTHTHVLVTAWAAHSSSRAQPPGGAAPLGVLPKGTAPWVAGSMLEQGYQSYQRTCDDHSWMMRKSSQLAETQYHYQQPCAH